MIIKVPYKYTESIIPKRCRKPRPVEFKDILSVEVREVSTMDAPVAIIEHDNVLEKESLAFRWFDNRLWTNVSTFRPHDGKYKNIHDYFKSHSYVTKEKVIQQIEECANSNILINHKIFHPAGEPRYVIMTFGLGCNHGGTALMTDYSYNSNIHHARYYRIDQRQEAIAESERIALSRGDTKDVPITPHSNFEILIPEAIRLNPVAEHGDGDPFINGIEDVIENVKNPLLAGLVAMNNVFKEVC